jgi:putative GTP pyrophosphokinase
MEEDRNILGEYDERAPLYAEFASAVHALLAACLDRRRIKVHSVSSRLKKRTSLAGKLAGAGYRYARIDDVTDIAGVRVVTYFADEVDNIARLIEEEFAVDWANSVDKRAMLEHDRFGYLSLHHVVGFLPATLGNAGYEKFSGMKAEIQTRSLLQHAWAAIEHDLGYKSALAVPREQRRKFSRFAGLLELADQEFMEIRRALTEYERTVSTRIHHSPQMVSIDKASLSAFLSDDEELRRLDAFIATAAGGAVTEHSDFFVEQQVNRLQALGFHSIGDVKKSLSELSPEVEAFARKWFEGKKRKYFVPGIGLVYLGYVYLAKKGDKDLLLRYLANFRPGPIPLNDGRAQQATQILSVYGQLRNGA